MKIVMKTLLANPRMIVHPGEEVDLPEKEARSLINEGFAIPVQVEFEKFIPPETATKVPAETAARRVKPPQVRRKSPAKKKTSTKEK